jgi:predicted Fe-Mo cluster-binding NifX family protein
MQMKIVITANGAGLDAPTSPVFGRCPAYVFVDTETAGENRPIQFEAVENVAIGASSGAGIQAAQSVIERGVQAVVAGNVGPNAFAVLQSAGVPVYLFEGGTVGEAIEAFRAGRLQSIADANVQAGMGMGGGMGRGMGSGMGRGTGRGMGMGRRAATPPTPPASPPAPTPAASREEDIAALKEMAGELQRQLSEVMGRLDRLQEEE